MLDDTKAQLHNNTIILIKKKKQKNQPLISAVNGAFKVTSTLSMMCCNQVKLTVNPSVE